MANSNATQIKINLQDSLNLNTNKAEISDFAGFNRRNSPFFNGGLSPLFKQEKAGSVIDKKGNVYKCENGNFYKNDVVIASGIEQQEFVRTKLENVPTNPATKWTVDAKLNVFSVTPESSERGILSYSGWTEEIDLFTHFQVGHLTCASKGFGSRFISYDRGMLYCVTWKETGVGRFYWCFDDLLNPTFNNINTITFDFSSVFPETDFTPVRANVAVSTENYTLTKGVAVENIYGWVVKLQFFDSYEYLVKSKSYPFVIIGPTKGSISSTKTYPLENSCFCINYNNPKELYIQESSDNYLTGKFNTTDSPFYISYKIVLSGSVSAVSVSFSGYLAHDRLSGAISADNNYVFADGKTVYANGITVINEKPVSLSISEIFKSKFSIGEGCNAPNDNGKYDSFSKNMCIVSPYDGFDLLYNNNYISGISYNGTLLTPFLDVDSTAFSVERVFNFNINGTDSQQHGILYKSNTDGNYYILNRQNQSQNALKIVLNRFIVLNTVGFINAYDIELNAFTHLFNDNNNRYLLNNTGGFSLIAASIKENPISVASGMNVNYEIKQNPNISAVFNPALLYCVSFSEEKMSFYHDNIRQSIDEDFISAVFEGQLINPVVDLYYNEVANETPIYIKSEYLNADMDAPFDLLLKDVVYPVSTDGNIILSPSAFATFYDSQIGADYIKDGRYYNLIYYEGMPILAYYYGSGVANSEARFVIQGQSFVIRNGLIYSTYYNNGLMYVNDPIVNVDDLQFIGALPLAAFFYSPATKCVLMFTGDRNLSTAFEATELKSVNSYKYAPNDNSLYLATDDAVYVLFNTPDGNSFVYKIEEENIIDFVPQDNGCIAMKGGDTWNIFSFFERENFNNVPVRLSTKFYGAGLNRVSVVDCWYIRLFTDTPKAGKVKVKVETLTNKACTSEEQTFEISKEKWEESNNIVYIRYQPKLQRGVGVSLTVESDFTVYDIQASVKPDSTIQLTPESSVQVSAEKGI